MNSNTIAIGILKSFLLILLLLLVLYFAYNIKSAIAYIVLAIVFSLIGRPLVLTLRYRLKLPNILAVTLTISLLFSLLVGLIWLFIPVITEHGEKLTQLNLRGMQAELELLFKEFSTEAGESKELVEEIVEDVDIEETVKEELETGFIGKVLNSALEIIGTMSVSLFSIVFISFFLLKDTKEIQSTLLSLVPERYRLRVISSMDRIKNLLSRYFVGLLLQMLVLFTIYAITLRMVGIENPLALALLCALFNIIPYLGPIIGAICMLLFTITTHMGEDFQLIIIPKLGYVLVGVAIGQLIDNFFSQPYFFSASTKSHPLEIFLIILLAGLMFGVVGMIVAVPSYTVVKVLIWEFFPNSRLAVAMAKQFD